MDARALYARAMARIYWACIWIAGLGLVVMTAIIPWGVFARYVLGTGSSWPEPLAILLMILFTFFGAAACYRANAHIAVTLFQDALQPRAKRAAGILVDLLMALCALFMVVWGFQLSAATWNQQIGEYPWVSVGVSYLPLPIGSLVTLLFIIEHVWIGPAKDLEEPDETVATAAEAN
jgi:TRAP-type C4-dicarboxylate transport system permease small subunit